jgi:glycosyltransferase involved in cell wall biosynthesis
LFAPNDTGNDSFDTTPSDDGNLPFFSIIIPAYNEEKFLPGCLQSIQQLDYPKDRYEVIVVDNGSTDCTRDIAASFNAAVILKPELNVAGLRNCGARNADGNVLAFVDADCAVDRNWLRGGLHYAFDDKVAVWGAPAVPPENATWVQKTWFLVRKKEKAIQQVNWLETMNLFVRKYHFFEAGGFNESLVTCEDVDFSYRIKRYGMIISDSALKVVHFGEAATIGDFVRKEIWRGRGNLKGIKAHGFTIKELPSLLLPVYFGAFLPILFVTAIVIADITWFFFGLVLLLLPSVLVLIRFRHKIMNITNFFRLFALLQVYFLSRTIAVVKTG